MRLLSGRQTGGLTSAAKPGIFGCALKACVRKRRSGAHSDWHLAGLPPGVYVYEIITEDGRRQVGKVQKW